MKRLGWVTVTFLSFAVVGSFAFAGCGSDTSPDIGDDGGSEGSGDDATGGGDANPSGDDGSSDGSFIDAIVDGGRDPDSSALCKGVGTSCGASTECCTDNCRASDGGAGKVCEAQIGLCTPPGGVCKTGNECCTFSCVSGQCDSRQCVADNGACAVDSDCCGQSCVPNGKGGGMCAPLNTSCKTSGNPCGGNADCCSKFCNGGVCSGAPSYCTQPGDICSSNAECCGGLCNIAAGKSVGLCQDVTAGGTKPCVPDGEVCNPNGTCTTSCCSRSCAPYPPSGVSICAPTSGCHLTGDLCMTDNECCGAPGAPGSTNSGGKSTNVQCLPTGRAPGVPGLCGNGNACIPAGGLCKPGNLTDGGALACSTAIDCCAGNANVKPTCQLDSQGIPRCTVTGNLNCAGGPPPAGTACASSADCCDNPCIPNPAGGQPAFVCGTPGQCQRQGMTCTTNADCCTGLPCAIPPGASTGLCGGTVLADGGVSDAAPPGSDSGVITNPDGGGTCGLYGQACLLSSDCCSGVPCTNGTCHYP